jgi:RNA polymerase sigma-70 factor (ECF subfamily)
MFATSISLLENLRQDPTESRWQRLVDLYSPLIRLWLRRYALIEQDVDDVVQEVLAVVVGKMPEFQRKPQAGAFRRWLRTITVNCLRGFWRAERFRARSADGESFADVLDQLEDANSALSKVWDQEHDDFVAQQLLAMIQPRFEAKTWQAFQRVALEGIPVDQAAQELGLTANAVFIAKSRVLQQLRQEAQGLLD